MTEPTTPFDRDQMLDIRRTSEILGVPVNTLSSWRYQGRGPEYLRIGKRVFYRRSALVAFIEASTVKPIH